MKELLIIMNEFEKRNNISISLTVCSDGSGTLDEFWELSEIFSFSSADELIRRLKTVELEKASDGRSIAPTVIIKG